MKVTILTYVSSEASKEYDVVVDQVAQALREGGHTPTVLGVHDDLGKLIGRLKRLKPDLVFNLLEMFNNKLMGDVEVAGLLDLLDLPYTGGGPIELALQLDKGLAKKSLAFDQIPYPDFAVFSRDDLETGGNLRMPLFVKPLKADASIGISSDSLVRDATALMKRVVAIHEKFGDSALAEEYIEGREFYVGILGNRDPQVFPPIEMDFSGLPADAPRVLDSKAKWAKRTAPSTRGRRPSWPRSPTSSAPDSEGLARRLPRASGPRLRPRRPPPDRCRRDSMSSRSTRTVTWSKAASTPRPPPPRDSIIPP